MQNRRSRDLQSFWSTASVDRYAAKSRSSLEWGLEIFQRGCWCIRGSSWLDAPGGAPVRKSQCFTDLLSFCAHVVCSHGLEVRLHKGALKYAKSSLARPSKFLVRRFGGPLCREIALKSGMGLGDFPKGVPVHTWEFLAGCSWWSPSAEITVFHRFAEFLCTCCLFSWT